ncbi:MAG: alanyl-tRNA editing protein, partial [Alkalispirochaeta sp.]
MTHPSYYDDPLAHTFVTTVSAVDPDGAFVTLAETLFYPEGGGQPADIGSLGGAKVVDVQKDDTGTIHHYLASPPDTALQPGDRITGTVDMAHRWDYMQQHTGQHVLSAALAQVAEAPTVSVHQGSELTTIEVDQESLSESVLEAVEDRANKIVRADLPVRGFWIDHTELPNYALRRPTSRTGKIRLVEIDGVDLVACGGVH